MAINRNKRITAKRNLLFNRLSDTKRFVNNALENNRIAIKSNSDFLTTKEIDNLGIIETLIRDMESGQKKEKIKIYNHLEI